MLITEVRVKGENEHIADIPREEMERLLKSEQVDAILKYGSFDRGEPEGEAKAVYSMNGPFLAKDRPRAQSVISSGSEDRDGDTVVPGGMIITENYQRNPVVLPMHTHDFPVGFTRRLKQTSKDVWAEWEWLTDLPDNQAEKYAAWWAAYALNCTSIGFIPTEWENKSEDGGMWGGWKFTQWELLEYSPVVIPSNRDAMRTDGIKQVMEQFGEMVMTGPSPVLKSFWVAGESKDRPKQVSLGAVVVDVKVEGKGEAIEALGGVGVVAGAREEKDPAITAGDPIDPDLELAKECAETEDEPETFEEIKLACAAGVLPTERAFELIEQIVKELEQGADAARTEAAQWKGRCAVLSARVIKRYGGEMYGQRSGADRRTAQAGHGSGEQDAGVREEG